MHTLMRPCMSSLHHNNEKPMHEMTRGTEPNNTVANVCVAFCSGGQQTVRQLQLSFVNPNLNTKT